MIALFFEGFTNPNGTATFTEHLYDCFALAGHAVHIFKIRKTRSSRYKLYRGCNITVHQVTLEDALEIVKCNPAIITQLPHANAIERYDSYKELLYYGVPYVLHSGPGGVDRQLHGWATELALDLKVKVVVVRDTIRNAVISEFSYPENLVISIPHPYVRKFSDFSICPEHNCIAIGRVSSEKKTHVICEANRLISDRQFSKDCRIEIFGSVSNRLYEYSHLSKKYPEWKDYHRDEPQKLGMSTVDICRISNCAIDLSEFTWDGGGSQYTFLEAMDAGCDLVLNRNWLKFPGEMQENYNCHAVDDAEELANYVLSCNYAVDHDAYAKTLRLHSPELILPQYLEIMQEGL